MKLKKIYSLLIIILLVISACSKSDKKGGDIKIMEKIEIAENIKNIEVDIEGMTCEIGCAKLIQSKLYKTDGVKFAEINFENKLGNISFDANKISTEDIENEIQKIAGGDLYKVTHSKEVESFTVVNKIQ